MKKIAHPFLQNAFPPRWSDMKPSLLMGDVNKAIAAANKNFEKIAELKNAELSYETCVRAFDRACADINLVWNWANHLDAVNNSADMRAAIAEALPVVTDFYSSIYFNEKLWGVIKKFSESAEAKKLDGYKKTLLEEIVLDFKTSGADLPQDKMQRLKTVKTLLAQKTQKFSENVLDAINSYSKHVDDPELIKGLPQSALDLAAKKAAAEGKTGWVFTLEQPSLIPVLTYAESDDLREELWRASVAIGRSRPFDNLPLISEILKLRTEYASILGHANFADLVLFRRMAKNGRSALRFIEDIHLKIKSAFSEDTARLEAFKAKLENGASKPLAPWQVAYYAQLELKSLYDFNPETMRPYFAFERVMDGLFKICKKLFGLSVAKAPKPDVWDDNVEFYEVHNERGKHIGSFYADFFPRKQKRGGAWMNLLKPAKGISPALGFIGGNFNEPANGKPALLSHDEVATLFHEFGHLIHFFMMDCTETGLREVAWDFVELPSQIMENWCSKKECLDIFAEHWQLKDLMPAKIFDAFDKSRKFRGASGCMRQLALAFADLNLHLYPQKFADDPESKTLELLKDYLMPLSEKQPSILPRFTHIFGDSVGYAAGYYSYKWAEVLDADAFTRFEKDGILNEKTGREFANKILRVGKTVKPDEAFENFMGRPACIDALLKRTL